LLENFAIQNGPSINKGFVLGPFVLNTEQCEETYRKSGDKIHYEFYTVKVNSRNYPRAIDNTLSLGSPGCFKLSIV
jgi:hypothetical protein